MWRSLLWVSLLFATSAPGQVDDPHYNSVGFFDIHVCNWPDKPRFLMALFSTTRFDEVTKVSVFAPDGKFVGDLDLSRFRVFKTPSGRMKRAFITHFDLPQKTMDGWYRATVILKDARRFTAKDYVVHYFMPGVERTQPADNAHDVAAGAELSWDPVPGAQYYQVTIRDIWDTGVDGTVSNLLAYPRYLPPPGVLQPGGEYVWRVHARDSNGNVLLGDFNHGSVSREMRFSVK